jgi:hypothetical protein
LLQVRALITPTNDTPQWVQVWLIFRRRALSDLPGLLVSVMVVSC